MITFLLSIFFLLCVAIFACSLKQRDRIIQFPFLIACVYLGWMFPQFLGLINDQILPPGSLEKTIIMAILCLVAAWLGYTQNKRPANLFWWKFDRHRLLWCSALLSIIGAFFFFQVNSLAVEATAQYGGGWTGVITIYNYFASLLTFGMATALLLYINKPSWTILIILFFDIALYLDRIIIKGKRGAAVELGLMLLLAIWYQRRWVPPRWLMIVCIVFAVAVINSIGDYRSTVMGEDRTTWSGAGLKEILEVDYYANLIDTTHGGMGSNDIRNAAFSIEAADRKLSFDFGLSHWNGFVRAYIPAQFMGHDFKNSLMLDFGNPMYSEFSYIPHDGSTNTGLSDAFLSFWYFGMFKFLLIGFIISRWNEAALRGNIVAQLFLMLTMTSALHAITHSTDWFFTIFVKLAVFMLPVLIFARIKSKA